MPFPPKELAFDYTANPWQDSFGQQWLYDATLNRWNAAPSATTGGGTTGTGGGIIVSLAPPSPAYSGLRWFRTIDCVTYTYYDGFWVANDSAPIPALDDVWAELDTKLATVTEPQTVADANSNMLFSQANAYLRFTANVAKTYTVIVADGMAIGSTVTLRNVGLGNLTIANENNLIITITGETASFTIPPNGTGQLIKVATNLWDLI
jgi:hypothetical protein